MQNLPRPKISKNMLYIGIAVVLAILASLVAIRYVQQQVEVRTKDDRQMIEVAVPTRDMQQGTIIAEGDLAVRRVPAELAPADVVTPENYADFAGRVLRSPVRGGAPLSSGSLVPLYDQFSRIIPRGKVAYTLSVDENNSISGMVAPGDLIDILFLRQTKAAIDMKDGAQTEASKEILPLLDQVRVLATGSRVGERVTPEGQPVSEEAQGFSSVTLELDHYQAKQLAIADEAGSLRVLLRESEDRSPGAANGLSENELLRSLGSYGRQGSEAGNAIEFIIGGRG